MSGNFSVHDQCLWCVVPRSKLSSLHSYAPRTLNSNRILAHLPPLASDGTATFPFHCEVCSKTFHNQQAVNDEKLTPAQLTLFPKIHKGVLWQHSPCTSTPITNIIPCVLHMRLRFCCTLWDWLIAPSVLVKRSAAVATKIMQMLQSDGVNTNRLRKLNDFSDSKSVKHASFDGNGCDKVLLQFDDYMVASGSKHRDLGYLNLFQCVSPLLAATKSATS